MISVREIDDIPYVKEVLSRPGMGKLVSGTGEHVSPDLIDKAVEMYELKFVGVEDDGERRGFVMFARSGEHSGFVHLALQTRGEKTLSALMQAMELARDKYGMTEIHALYPDRESLEHLGTKAGFGPSRDVDAGMGVPFKHRVKQLT